MDTTRAGGAGFSPAGGNARVVLTDDELTAEALGAETFDPFSDDAVPFTGGNAIGPELLPEWYMPVPQLSASERTPRRVFTVGMIVFALLLLNGAGLCVTYGLPEIAW